MTKVSTTYLICIENYRLLSVVFLHHLHGDPGYGWLEVCLLSVHHHPHVKLLGGGEESVHPPHAVPELLLFLIGEVGDERFHTACLEVGNLELLLEVVVHVNVEDTLPVEHVDDAPLVVCDVLQELLHGGLLHLHPGLRQVLLEGLLVHVTLNDGALLPRHLLVVLPGPGDDLGQLELKYDCHDGHCQD